MCCGNIGAAWLEARRQCRSRGCRSSEGGGPRTRRPRLRGFRLRNGASTGTLRSLKVGQGLLAERGVAAKAKDGVGLRNQEVLRCTPRAAF